MKNVAIIGSCPSSRLYAPYGKDGWETWSMSPDNIGAIPDVDAWFELHADLGCVDAPKWERPYFRFLNEGKFQLYVQRKDLFPRAIEFPAAHLIQKYGPYWFTSTMAWMLAFAIDRGAKEIGLYGVDASRRDEYLSQRPALQYWILYAMERGIIINVPHESDLMAPPPLYGYSWGTNMGRKLQVREKELRGRIAELDAQSRKIDHERAHLQGALDDLDYVQTVWTGNLKHEDGNCDIIGGAKEGIVPRPALHSIPGGA